MKLNNGVFLGNLVQILDRSGSSLLDAFHFGSSFSFSLMWAAMAIEICWAEFQLLKM